MYTAVLRYCGTAVLRYTGTVVLRYCGTPVLRYLVSRNSATKMSATDLTGSDRIWLVDIDNIPISIVRTIPEEDIVYLFGNNVDGKNVRFSLSLLNKILRMTAKNKLFLNLTDIVKKNSADFNMCFHTALICSKYKNQRVLFRICSKDHGFETLKENILKYGEGNFSVILCSQEQDTVDDPVDKCA